MRFMQINTSIFKMLKFPEVESDKIKISSYNNREIAKVALAILGTSFAGIALFSIAHMAVSLTVVTAAVATVCLLASKFFHNRKLKDCSDIINGVISSDNCSLLINDLDKYRSRLDPASFSLLLDDLASNSSKLNDCDCIKLAGILVKSEEGRETLAFEFARFNFLDEDFVMRFAEKMLNSDKERWVIAESIVDFAPKISSENFSKLFDRLLERFADLKKEEFIYPPFECSLVYSKEEPAWIIAAKNLEKFKWLEENHVMILIVNLMSSDKCFDVFVSNKEKFCNKLGVDNIDCLFSKIIMLDNGPEILVEDLKRLERLEKVVKIDMLTLIRKLLKSEKGYTILMCNLDQLIYRLKKEDVSSLFCSLINFKQNVVREGAASDLLVKLIESEKGFELLNPKFYATIGSKELLYLANNLLKSTKGRNILEVDLDGILAKLEKDDVAAFLYNLKRDDILKFFDKILKVENGCIALADNLKKLSRKGNQQRFVRLAEKLLELNNNCTKDALARNLGSLIKRAGRDMIEVLLKKSEAGVKIWQDNLPE